jgi:hypothetical protein
MGGEGDCFLVKIYNAEMEVRNGPLTGLLVGWWDGNHAILLVSCRAI